MTGGTLKTLTKNETKALVKVGSDADFPSGTKWSQKIYFYEGAVKNINSTAEDNKVRLLAAFVFHLYYDRYRVGVAERFGEGDRARVVLQSKDGKLSLADEDVGSVEEGKKVAKQKKYAEQGLQLADASMLKNTEFIEQNAGKILVFGSENRASLSGSDDLTAEYYLAGAREAEATQKTGSTTAAMVDSELKKVLGKRDSIKKTTEKLAEEDAQLAAKEQKLRDLKTKAEQADKERQGADEKTKVILEELHRSA